MLNIKHLIKKEGVATQNDASVTRKEREPCEQKTYVLQRSMKFTNTVFFVPSRRTWGGLITVLRLSPASSGLFSRRMLNTLPRSCIIKSENQLPLTKILKANQLCAPGYDNQIYDTSALMQIKQATSSGRSTTSTVNHPLCQFNPSPSTDSYIRTHTDLNCPWT